MAETFSEKLRRYLRKSHLHWYQLALRLDVQPIIIKRLLTLNDEPPKFLLDRLSKLTGINWGGSETLEQLFVKPVKTDAAFRSEFFSTPAKTPPSKRSNNPFAELNMSEVKTNDAPQSIHDLFLKPEEMTQSEPAGDVLAAAEHVPDEPAVQTESASQNTVKAASEPAPAKKASAKDEPKRVGRPPKEKKSRAELLLEKAEELAKANEAKAKAEQKSDTEAEEDDTVPDPEHYTKQQIANLRDHVLIGVRMYGSCNQLAKKVGVSAVTVSKWCDKYIPRPEKLPAIAQALGCQVPELMRIPSLTLLRKALETPASVGRAKNPQIERIIKSLIVSQTYYPEPDPEAVKADPALQYEEDDIVIAGKGRGKNKAKTKKAGADSKGDKALVPNPADFRYKIPEVDPCYSMLNERLIEFMRLRKMTYNELAKLMSGSPTEIRRLPNIVSGRVKPSDADLEAFSFLLGEAKERLRVESQMPTKKTMSSPEFVSTCRDRGLMLISEHQADIDRLFAKRAEEMAEEAVAAAKAESDGTPVEPAKPMAPKPVIEGSNVLRGREEETVKGIAEISTRGGILECAVTDRDCFLYQLANADLAPHIKPQTTLVIDRTDYHPEFSLSPDELPVFAWYLIKLGNREIVRHVSTDPHGFVISTGNLVCQSGLKNINIIGRVIAKLDVKLM